MNNMLKVNFDNFNFSKVDYSVLKTTPQYNLLLLEVDFAIEINGEVFFGEPDFPILEFLQQILLWEELSGDFHYTSLEVEEDNPLISFIHDKGKFRVYSPWQKFECFELFSKENILTSILGRQGKKTGDG